MKKTLVIALAAALAVPTAFATDAVPAGQMMMDPEQQAEHMSQHTDLDLTDAQKQQIQALMQEQRTKHDAIRAETRQRMDVILTPGQRQKLDAHKTQMMEMRDQRQEMRAERQDNRADRKRDKKAEKAARKAAWKDRTQPAVEE